MDTRLPPRLILVAAALLPLCAAASSHREAPSIAGMPRVDGTDFYMFRSYEPGRSAYVTFIANYIPLEDPQGGPNFFNLDSNAVYEILVSNAGGAVPDLRFAFKFSTINKDLAVDAGGKQIPVPIINTGVVSAAGANLNVIQSYTLEVARGDWVARAENVSSGGDVFYKPADNIGNKSIPDYEAYASHFVYDVRIPGLRGSAQGGLRRQLGRSVRPRQHESGRAARWAAEYSVRQECDLDCTRSPDQLCDLQDRYRHRRVHDGESTRAA
jgi:hypothetical protein